MPRGVFYEINGVQVTPPDSEQWQTEGQESLAGTEKRSPYHTLVWTKRVADPSRLDWFEHDNTILASLTCVPNGRLDEYETYTDVICKRVVGQKQHDNMTQVTATFLVCVE